MRSPSGVAFWSRLRPGRRAFGSALLVALGAGCDHWPGVDDNPSGGGGYAVGSSDTSGTCSGTPLPCGELGGADCSTTPGCMDQGSCAGTSTVVAQPCGGALSFQGCNAIAGCFWAASCSGTPLGACSGFTQQSCLLAKGCVFTPSGSGGSSSSGGGFCTTFGQACSSAAACDCGFSCVQACAGCRAACGTPCISDGDCTNSTGAPGTPTPYCVGVPSPPVDPYSGMCSSSR